MSGRVVDRARLRLVAVGLVAVGLVAGEHLDERCALRRVGRAPGALRGALQTGERAIGRFQFGAKLGDQAIEFLSVDAEFLLNVKPSSAGAPNPIVGRGKARKIDTATGHIRHTNLSIAD